MEKYIYCYITMSTLQTIRSLASLRIGAGRTRGSERDLGSDRRADRGSRGRDEGIV